MFFALLCCPWKIDASVVVQGALVKVSLPPGEPASCCLLFQIGETTQALSGGALQATPHAVRATSQEGGRRRGIREAKYEKILVDRYAEANGGYIHRGGDGGVAHRQRERQTDRENIKDV